MIHIYWDDKTYQLRAIAGEHITPQIRARKDYKKYLKELKEQVSVTIKPDDKLGSILWQQGHTADSMADGNIISLPHYQLAHTIEFKKDPTIPFKFTKQN